nr:type III-A CRISPR-associated RAMP protein Csm3 [Pelistega indica]
MQATLTLQSGLHIGGGDTEIHIGGIDNAVIKHPLTNEPYIPGSSLKGKVRSLLEWRSGVVQEAPLAKKDFFSAKKNGNENQAREVKHILQIFGASGDANDSEFSAEIGHTRVSFWDCLIDKEYLNFLQENNLPYTEAKTENSINRISGTASNPRQTERVPAGTQFSFTLSFKQFEGDDEALLNTLLKGLKLLEWDSLGGSGSRGYGKISFSQLTINGEDAQQKFDEIQPF